MPMGPRRLLALLAAVLVLVPVFGMIRALTLPDLVKQSELIVLARVEKVAEIARDAQGISTVKNVLTTEKILKGSWDQREPLVIMTRQGAADGRIGSIEDQVEFPPKGFQVLLFLKKNVTRGWETVNLVQGIWPMKDRKLLGMGFGTTFEQVENAARKP